MIAALTASITFEIPSLLHWFGPAIVGYTIICFVSSMVSLTTEHDSRWLRTITAIIYLIMLFVAGSGNYHGVVTFETWVCVGSIGIVTLLLPLALWAMKKEDESATTPPQPY